MITESKRNARKASEVTQYESEGVKPRKLMI